MSVAAACGALLDLGTSRATRVGVSQVGAPSSTPALDWCALPEPGSRGWRVELPVALHELFATMASHEADPEVAVPTLPLEWHQLAGFFREYLEDLDPSLDVDVIGREQRGRKTVFQTFAGPTQIADEERGRARFHVPLRCRDRERPRARPTDIVVSVRRDVWQKYPVARGRPDLAGVCASFAEAYFLTLLAHLLEAPDARHAWTYDRARSRELLRRAARTLVDALFAPIAKRPHEFDAYEALCILAALRYERREGGGQLYVCDPEDPATPLDWIVRLSDPFPFQNARQVRKLLETSGADAAGVVTDTHLVFGVARPPQHDHYCVAFRGENEWQLLQARGTEDALLVVEREGPKLPRPKLIRETLTSALRAVWPDLPASVVESLFLVAQGAAEQRHGASVVVTDDAAGEASRLLSSSTPIRPQHLGRDEARLLASIDGALLLDPAAVCHAIGVIVDGVANHDGDPARGARFNSLQRYVALRTGRGQRALAIVFSEDGGISWIGSGPVPGSP